MKVVTGVKAMLAAAMAAVGLAAFAKPSVEITNVSLANARDGQVNYNYKVDGEFEEGEEYDVLIKVSVANGTKSTVLTHESVAGGSTVSTNLNVQTLFGKAYPNVALFAELKELGGVRLWKGGPIWASCNVGATKPWESGYYFWWGDTVGYVWTGSRFDAVDESRANFSFSNGNSTITTYDKTIDWLYNSGGYIDANSEDGKLKPEYDAARKYLKGDWRMPTSDEIQALVDSCTCEWTTTNGVNGYIVRGKGAYESRSIFLPAAGYGDLNSRSCFGTHGFCWSSSPNTGDAVGAWYLGFDSSTCQKWSRNRYWGFAVRPVRDAE